MKKNKIKKFYGKWMEIEKIILNEATQAQKENTKFSLIYRPCLKSLDGPSVIIEYRETNRDCGGRWRKKGAEQQDIRRLYLEKEINRRGEKGRRDK